MCSSPGNMSEGVDLIDIYADEEFNQVWSLGGGRQTEGGLGKEKRVWGHTCGAGIGPVGPGIPLGQLSVQRVGPVGLGVPLGQLSE